MQLPRVVDRDSGESIRIRQQSKNGKQTQKPRFYTAVRFSVVMFEERQLAAQLLYLQ